jgi:hypothetical protein
MSSETSIEASRQGEPANTDQLQPWQLFTLAGLAGATAVVFVTRDAGPAAVILLSITVGAAAFVGLAAWRTLAPLAGSRHTTSTEVLGGRTRAALEREKTLLLRAIKDLEFDNAMGKVAEKDFVEMSARLRQRAAGLLRQLDSRTGYRDEIEKELEKRIGSPVRAATKVAAYDSPVAASEAVAGRNSSSGVRCACGTTNDPDAKFCKNCGAKLE